LDDGAVIIELGGGANPVLKEEIVTLRKFNYLVIDTSKEELQKATGEYFTRIHTDIEKTDVEYKADLIISKMVLEHIPNPNIFHQSIFNLLKNNGSVIHFYATLYNIASISNILLPEFISSYLVKRIQKRDATTEAKFPAFYRKCFGPTKNQIDYFNNLGYNITQFNGYLGHHYFYFNKLLYKIENLYNKILLRINSPYFCSNAILILKKYD